MTDHMNTTTTDTDTDTDTESSDRRIAIEIEGHTLQSGSTLAHEQYGPMVIDHIQVGSSHKTALLTSELGPEALECSAEELRTMWGETIHVDPMAIQQPTVTFGGLSVEGLDIEAELSVSGDTAFKHVERVAVHAREQLVRSMQAERDHSHPEDCEGTAASVDWDAVLDTDTEGST